eukprot:TRINITY_DN17102_c0_g1_i1.p1 TRINITY_DN17102_c0_g1~~TRINITY_DN17102_c0_g1_i1.p1  ORF type:complete len:239 (+),score=78.09 TRINITY_DN17102_c0_g1_i1:75-791(+)
MCIRDRFTPYTSIGYIKITKMLLVPIMGRFCRMAAQSGVRNFSEYFSNIDKAALIAHNKHYYEPLVYTRMQRKWRLPLERKRRYKELKKQRLATIEKRPAEEEKIVAHDAERGIEFPVAPENIFAVFELAGTQYKVTMDDKLICNRLPFEVGEKVEFDKVLLVGTKDYTSVGRPYVNSARVIASIEEQARSKKLIVYKKERRKSYQRNYGHRQPITVLHIDQIVHTPTEQALSDYNFV